MVKRKKLIPKKKKIKKRIKKHPKLILQEAMDDISKELRELGRDKLKLIKQIENLDSKVVSKQNRESVMRDRITKLIAEESLLSSRKGNTQTRIQKIKEKIGKIKKIKEDLGEV